MKVRYDFVTNSSSSSFVCFGVRLDELTIPDKTYLDFYNKECTDNFCRGKECTTDNEKIECAKKCSEFKYSYLNQGMLSFGGPDSRYNSAVGINPVTLINKYPDAKIGEIYDIVAKELNNTLGTTFTKKDIIYYEEGWYDG